MCASVHLRLYVCVCVCVCVYMYLHVCVYVYVCVFICLCVDAFVRVCAYTCVRAPANASSSFRKTTRNKQDGRVTHTMWARLRGFSEVISGNMGWGGSLLEAQLRDLLSAWDSFLAGDFCRNTEATGEVSADAWSRAEGRLPLNPH